MSCLNIFDLNLVFKCKWAFNRLYYICMKVCTIGLKKSVLKSLPCRFARRFFLRPWRRLFLSRWWRVFGGWDTLYPASLARPWPVPVPIFLFHLLLLLSLLFKLWVVQFWCVEGFLREVTNLSIVAVDFPVVDPCFPHSLSRRPSPAILITLKLAIHNWRRDRGSVMSCLLRSTVLKRVLQSVI